MMRGFRVLAQTPDGLELVTEIKDTLSRTPFTRRRLGASRHVFGAAQAHAQVAVHQFLMTHLAMATLHESILLAVATRGPLVHPLPGPWRQAVPRHGLRVAHVRCALLWYGAILGAFGLGVVTLVKAIVSASRSTRTPASRSLHNAAFFDALSLGALPQPGEDGRSFDVLTWYARWSGRHAGVRELVHTVAGGTGAPSDTLPVRQVAGPVPHLSGVGGASRLAWWGICAAVIAVLDLARGRWWHALMFRPAVPAAVARLQPGALARDYLFHNSGWLFRPLWTYEAEAQGGRVLFYFYSTNVETFKYPSGYPIQANTWNVTNWPHYLVWDETQANFVRRNCPGDPIVDIVGSIWFHSSDLPMPNVPEGAVAVFDIQPVRDSAYQIRGAAKVYYLPAVSRAFLADVRGALAATGRAMVFKRKRKTPGGFTHGKYRRDVAAMSGDPNVLTIDPDIAAWRVVESCQAVISMPFTSTAQIGCAQGKPSIYYVPEYAPYAPVQDDDRGAHGIPIVRGPEALTAWLRALPGEPSGRYTPLS